MLEIIYYIYIILYFFYIKNINIYQDHNFTNVTHMKKQQFMSIVAVQIVWHNGFCLLKQILCLYRLFKPPYYSYSQQ